MMKDDFEGFFFAWFWNFSRVENFSIFKEFDQINFEFEIWFLGVIVHYDGSLHVIDGIKNLDLGKYLCVGKCKTDVTQL